MPKGQKTEAKDWIAVIETWKHSKLSKKKFCLEHNINYKNFIKWCGRLQAWQPTPLQDANQTINSSMLFIPVNIKSANAESETTIAKPLVLVLNQHLHLHIPIESVNVTLLNTIFKSLGGVLC